MSEAPLPAAKLARLKLFAGAVLAGGVALATVVAYLPSSRAWLARFTTQAYAFGAEHWLAFAAGQVAVVACGVLPASVMAVMAGAAYGLAKGLLISVIATMLGGWIAFMLSRSILRPWIEKLLARSTLSSRFDAALEGEGWRFIFLLRISPVMPFALTSYGLGLTSVRQRDFLIGTLASLPALVSYVGIGAMGRQGMTMRLSQAGPAQWALLVIGVIALLIAALRTRDILTRIAAK